MISISTTASTVKEENERRITNILQCFQISNQVKVDLVKYIWVEMYLKIQRSHLTMEYQILKEIQGGEGIPRVYDLYNGRKHYYLIMQLLGKSLEKLFTEAN